MFRALALMTGLAMIAAAPVLTGCASLTAGTYQDAVGRWRVGDPQGATAAAQAMYEKIRDANGLSEADVARAATGALEELEEVPTLTTGARPPVTSERALDGGAQALIMELRADMLGSAVTPVIRATAVVRDFALIGEYPALLAVVFRREALRADGGVLVGASRALRSVAAKWAALRVLEQFSRAARPMAASQR